MSQQSQYWPVELVLAVAELSDYFHHLRRHNSGVAAKELRDMELQKTRTNSYAWVSLQTLQGGETVSRFGLGRHTQLGRDSPSRCNGLDLSGDYPGGFYRKILV